MESPFTHKKGILLNPLYICSYARSSLAKKESKWLLIQKDVHIYSASWGPDDDGRTVDGPGPLTRCAASQIAKKTGGGGKANIVKNHYTSEYKYTLVPSVLLAKHVYLWAFCYPLEWNLWLKEKWQNYTDQVSDCIRYSTLKDHIQDNMLDIIRKGIMPKTWATLSQNQWGPFIIVARRALEEGAAKGRGGKGSIFVWASGNGGDVFGSCLQWFFILEQSEETRLSFLSYSKWGLMDF